jgi:hypothetical protein
MYAYDRSNKNNNPSGVTVYAAEIIHPNNNQDFSGSGSANWINIFGSGSVLTLSNGPGTSGLHINGPNTSSARHDWYIAISASPNTVGSKEFGSYYELEYL